VVVNPVDAPTPGSFRRRRAGGPGALARAAPSHLGEAQRALRGKLSCLTRSDTPDEPIRFGEGEPYTLGVEEELFLADPEGGRLLNASADVLEHLTVPERGEVKGEIHACQVELITDVCANVADALGVLRGLRRAVLDTGAGLIAAGTHPTAEEGDAEITDNERYELIGELLGDAAATPVSALHVHVGMPDAETAIRAFNGLRRHLPLLEAVAANSPFRHARDTGLASARALTLRGWPRSGAPREMESFDDFWHSTARLTAVADVPDYTFHWWKLRPHPRLGTVEIRALDVQASLAQTGALVAAVHALARHEAQADPQPGPPGEILEEASFRAARGGVEATLPDASGRLRPAAELLAPTIELARPSARELGCEAQLDSLTELFDAGGGAGIQRAAATDGDLRPVLEGLLERAARDAC
jgi:carboxylate-amine ligase